MSSTPFECKYRLRPGVTPETGQWLVQTQEELVQTILWLERNGYENGHNDIHAKQIYELSTGSYGIIEIRKRKQFMFTEWTSKNYAWFKTSVLVEKVFEWREEYRGHRLRRFGI